uniref:Fasciculation and elongation protein zeta-2-like n=1 Tax=Steinernema glaseri TaxID=37863 RepID=A0A1I7ZIE0_9BILA
MVIESETMDSDDLHVPNVPLASIDDDHESLKNGVTTEDLLNNASPSSVSSLDYEEAARLSESLEDLVGTFDQKINNCLKDLDENTQQMAPVQVRTQDEVMSESQVWWTLTGNYGNILPLDFSKSLTRQHQLDALHLSKEEGRESVSDAGLDMAEEEDLRQTMDMHQLVAQHSLLSGESPPQTADQVIEEIDQMLQSCDFTGSMMTDRTMESVDSMYSSMRSPYPASNPENPESKMMKQAAALTASPEKLESLSVSALVSLQAEMEQLIRVYNESLVEQLAHRDELDFEKELKNTFISQLLSLQNRKRQFQNERKRKGLKIDQNNLPQFMTASIPYDDTIPMVDNATLQLLIKILKAIDEDSSSVPSMLTDYILTVVCPSTNSSMIVGSGGSLLS